MKKNLLIFTAVMLLPMAASSCRTTAHFDKGQKAEAEPMPRTKTEKPGPATGSGTDYGRNIRRPSTARQKPEKEAERPVEEYEIEEALKEVDIERTVIYVDRPVYSPVEKQEPPLTGADAVTRSNADSLQIPMKFVNGVMYYAWDDSFVYEIHTTPYRTTDLMLEPGEQVLEMPFLSEEKVWEIGAGVSVEKGQDAQHFFLKPAYSGLTTSMIIITDRRVYHLLLKSFKNPTNGSPERYMVMVRFNYPPSMPFTVKSDRLQRQSDSINSLAFGTGLVDPRYLSFDYKMTYSARRKPVWLPQRVYDDGRKTYIVLDRRTLHSESPVLFNSRNERINYRIHENMIVIDELIEKVTLRRGKDKVTIVKKKYKKQAGEGDEL